MKGSNGVNSVEANPVDWQTRRDNGPEQHAVKVINWRRWFRRPFCIDINVEDEYE
jgi:hypothetical protein